MKIDVNTHTTFKSKNKVIRRADDIVRTLNNNYPRVSETNVEDFVNIDKFPVVTKLLDFKTMRMRSCISTKRMNAIDLNSMIRALPDAVKKFRCGNCYESAELAALAAKVNGLKDFSIGRVMSSDTGSLDHAVVVVKNGNNPYVLDAWLGFADYIPNAVERFNKEFSSHFNLSRKPNEKIYIKPQEIKSYQESVINNITSEEIEDIFPELLVKEKQNKPKISD